MSFIRVGNRYVNLDYVREILTHADGSAEVLRFNEPKALPATAEEMKAIVPALALAKAPPEIGLKAPAPK